jgi:hypothetical protein
MRDVGYIVWVMLGWPIVAAIIAAFFSGGDGQVLLAIFFVLVVGGWLVTLPRQPRGR